MTDAPDPVEAKAAYVKAQKQRNLFIALGLLLFVVLVFFISMSRMSSGLKRDAYLRAAAAAAESASAAVQAPASQ